MRLTIFGATGGVGRHLLAQAISAGHQVTAVVRDPEKLAQQVPFVKADLANVDGAALREAIAGADAVLSTLGPRSKTESGIVSTATRSIVQTMDATDVRRIVAISASPVATVPSPGRPNPPKHDPGDGLFMRHLLTPILKQAFGWIYADLAGMEDVLRASNLEWTIIRPPRLVNKPLTGSYRTAIGQNLHRGARISRADVAHLMLAILERPDTIRSSIGIAY